MSVTVTPLMLARATLTFATDFARSVPSLDDEDLARVAELAFAVADALDLAARLAQAERHREARRESLGPRFCFDCGAFAPRSSGCQRCGALRGAA